MYLKQQFHRNNSKKVKVQHSKMLQLHHHLLILTGQHLVLSERDNAEIVALQFFLLGIIMPGTMMRGFIDSLHFALLIN